MTQPWNLFGSCLRLLCILDQGSGITALHVAAMKNDVDTVRVLLNLKVDINATNVSNDTSIEELRKEKHSRR